MIVKSINLYIFIFLCLTNTVVEAACSVGSNESINLGQNSSFTVYNNSIAASNNVGLSCSGLLGLGILSGDQIIVTLKNSVNNLTLKNNDGSGDVIPYGIYADSTYQHQFLVNQAINYNSIGLLTLILGGKSFNIKFYVKTSPGANVRAGTYSDSLTFNWNYNICSLLGILDICVGVQKDNVDRTITVTAVIDKQCAINNAPDLNFGSYALVGQFNPITQNINLTCTKTEGYKVSFSDGNNRLANSWRRMTDGLGHYLQYNIYQTDGVTVWDTTNKLSASGTGLSQTIPYKAIINPSQTELPAATYTDQITVIVEY
ncbi:spore coat U domain-containing protein [Entomomonas sp. E2T0]|uniref:Csu type fimbrial protein n=1 Tax=Entomomonas sp. E2T0 TaxID=2930213 RepID=UPI002228406C|nr:spore coat protein U domain-containing protein [Entomomonas sp. E2T0]UYZ83601.1 spore coat U domain-containing protein [Entomomonas sp. E2T0]